MKKNHTRRNFIAYSALAGAVASFLPAFLSAGTGKEFSSGPFAGKKGPVFLFQGDSITDGNRGRNADPNHIMGHGYAFAIASRVGADFPTEGYTFYNRGVSGNTITDLEKRWQQDTLDIAPDVLSILIGVNDAGAWVEKRPGFKDITVFETVYRQLLTTARSVKPDLLFVLGIPFIYEVGKIKDDWPHWKEAVEQRALIVKKLAAEFNGVLIDYPAVFNAVIDKTPAEYWIWDGIHPTVPAHELMAREWIKRVAARLPFLKKYPY